MCSLPETLLARLTTPDRAAAIYGDITELSATRSRLWFWITYIRAVISLGWRTPAAFMAGCVSLVLFRFGGILFPGLILFQLGIPHQPFGPIRYIYLSAHPYIQQIISSSAGQLWLLAPFAIARYGFGDRLARLGLALLLVTTGMMLSIPVLSPFLAVASIAAIAVSLASASWRHPAITLVATTVVGRFTLFNLGFLARFAWLNYDRKPLHPRFHNYFIFGERLFLNHILFWVAMSTMCLLNMLVIAIVCSRIYKPLSRERRVIA